MRIRDAEIKDGAAIAALLGELGYPGTEDFSADKIARIVAHPDARLLVAQAEDGGVLGFIGLHFIVQLALPGDFCRITYFCVGEAARGLGVGRELEETAARLARERGCDRIEVHCHERRVDAHRFYYRQGYEESPKYLMKRA
ncbi:GNAT family N-acetyltransferase [Achromobacter sp. Marseille-Q0513]|uniref:GNAT family N-acetyltransferase n=1 Tax=Achromobacter sp. Marseille-Q0513 TaxID=2829161 RepID=UPI001B8E8BBD|nr:GNAT family N-acetyltransferase [Achromobacter sp. Marseille-Q0513]MBR8657429.1 GNAT family N-acetyltransferase [Achromobacter sp. Marseille-Q0513]